MRVCVQILPLVQSAVACRLELHSALPGNKDLLYLDLALEGVVRSAMERGIGSLGMGACAFVGPLLQNLVRPHPRLRCRVNALKSAWLSCHCSQLRVIAFAVFLPN